MVLAQAQPTPGQQTPTKRMRKESRAMAEFRQIASEAVSAYRMWWHCLNSESSSALISSRPTPGLRIRVFSAQHIVQPHLFCVKADILEVAAAAACDGVGLQPGQSLNVLLSFAVCMDALPQVARRMVQRIQSIAEAAHGDQLAFEAESVDIAVYWPWRVQGNQQSILASRFYIE
ncbi:hypothetical protein GGI12_000826 [Dipsacomyces acuminosporus]|nr:hypothetical protein GGI12_000826 [Dipsacomyces acuminosporus]